MHQATLRALVLVASLAACDHDEVRVCTLIGCNSVLMVTVAGAPDQAVVTVVAHQTETPFASMSSHCTANSSGSCSVSFPEFFPSNARVDVSWNSQTEQFSVQPTYQTSRPNGADCPPVCRFGMVSVTL